MLLSLFGSVFALSDDSQNSGFQNKLDNVIDVGSPDIKKIRIAIVPFVSSDSGSSHYGLDLSQLTKRFVELLDFTNWFDFVPESSYLSNKNPALDTFKAQNWSVLKTEFVVFGKLTPIVDSKNFNLELRLYNVKAQNLLLGKVYSNLNSKMADIALRRYGDLLLESLTGIQGPFMSKIAFVGKTNSRSSKIFIADFDGKNVFAISKNDSINISPAWSPDGTKLTYTTFKTGTPEIVEYNLITGKTIELTKGFGNSSGSTWSPDGEKIAFSSSMQNSKTHIYIMNSYGNHIQPFIFNSEIEVEPSFSPDGKFIAFTSNRFGKPMIFLRNLKTNEDTRLTYAGWYNASASWSPESSVIAFASYDRKIDRWDLFKIDVDGSHIQRLTLSQGDNEKPTWSPDGRFILFQSSRSSRGENTIHVPSKLYVMSKDGYFQREVPTIVPNVRQPAWGPRMDQMPFAEED
jgi:TolB protein